MAKKLERPYTLAIDIGGTGIKTLVLDKNGQAIGERLKEDTPQPATPSAVFGVLAKMITQAGSFDRVSVGFPGVVRKGIVETAPNLSPSWHDVDIQKHIAQMTHKPARAANDADVQGLGNIKGKG